MAVGDRRHIANNDVLKRVGETQTIVDKMTKKKGNSFSKKL